MSEKTALITGAAAGIGRALAEAAVRDGYRVLGVDIDREAAMATTQALGDAVHFIDADLTEPDEVARVVDEIDRVDLLIHNAGINEVGYFHNTNPVRQSKVISLNLLAPLLLTRGLLAKDALPDGASVVFISSLSRYVSYPGASVYAGTKDGLASYARSLAVGFPALHVMTVYPGPTRTAHARRYSPDNTREDSRMAPADLADYVMRGVANRRRIVIPGAANWAFAVFGRLLPGLADTVMRRTLLEKFDV